MAVQDDYAPRAARYRELRPKKRLLGTFGFRGVVNESITAEQAFRFGSALGRYLMSKPPAELFHPGDGGEAPEPEGPSRADASPEGMEEAGRLVVLARDVRTSSEMFTSAIAAGLMQCGVGTVDGGLLTPGGLSREIIVKEAHAGVMVTASHNPPQYNGIKLMNGAGRGFTPDQDLEFEGFYFADDAASPAKVPVSETGAPLVGRMRTAPGALEDYVSSMSEYVSGLYPEGSKLKVVVDAGGGNASKVTPRVLREFGCDVVEYNCSYDGEFRERPSEPSPENLARLSELVVEEGAAFGVGHDGDSDRTNFVDASGRFIQGDRTATMLLVELFGKFRSREMTEPLIPVNVAFSNILEDVAPRHGFEVLYTPVGEPAIAEAMHLFGAALGAEEMGSLVIRDWSWSREGPVLVPLMAGLLTEKGMSLAELDATFPSYHQLKTGMEMGAQEFARVKDEVAPRLREMDLGARRLLDIDGVRVFLDDGWFMVRASGTEPKFRIFSESRDRERAEALNRQGRKLLEECLG